MLLFDILIVDLESAMLAKRWLINKILSVVGNKIVYCHHFQVGAREKSKALRAELARAGLGGSEYRVT